MNTYDLSDVQKACGLRSTHAARKRVHAIKNLLEKRAWIVYDMARGGALSITPEGLQLVTHLCDLTAGGATIAEAAQAIRVELGEAEAPPDPHRMKKLEVRVKQLEVDVYALRAEVDTMRRPWWSRLLRLPAGKEEEK